MKLLAYLGQPGKAVEVYDQYASEGNERLAKLESQLRTLSKDAEKGEVFYRTKPGLEVYASVAETLGLSMLGKFGLEPFPALVPLSASFSLKDLGRVWRLVCSETGGGPSLDISNTSLWVVSEAGFSHQEVLVVPYEHPSCAVRFELVVLMETDRRRSAVYPFIAANPQCGAGVARPSVACCEDIAREVGRFQESGAARGWGQFVYQLLEQTVRRLVHLAVPDLFGQVRKRA